MKFAIYQSYVKEPSRFFAPSSPHKKLGTARILASSRKSKIHKNFNSSGKFLFPSTPVNILQDKIIEKPSHEAKPRTLSVLLKKVEIVFDCGVSGRSTGKRCEVLWEDGLTTKRPFSSRGHSACRKTPRRNTFIPRFTL
jgi:hypothetical protein